jgi:hypothetical protein
MAKYGNLEACDVRGLVLTITEKERGKILGLGLLKLY